MADVDTLVTRIRANVAVRVARLDSGQFNDILIVNDEWVFRFPKTAQATAMMLGEIEILRALAGRLPLPIPEPRYFSHEAEYPYMGYPIVPGKPLSHAALAELPPGALERIGRTMGGFLRQLHHTAIPALTGVATVRDGREYWADLYERIRTHLYPRMRPDARIAVSSAFETFLADAAHFHWTPVLRHGDFGGSNILHNSLEGVVTGVIDFGSAALGDPAVDIAALSTLGDEVLSAALASYPEAQACSDRAAFYRSTFKLQQAWYGLRDGSQEDYDDGIADYI